jgi:DNA repair protein RecO (recombination protein O)
MLVSDLAIVLGSKKFGDTSKILSIFTRNNGKISLIAKGARNSKSKFGASLEPLSYNKVSYYLYHNKDLHLLSTSEFNKHFKNLNESYDHLKIGLALIESLTLCQEQYLKNELLFDFLVLSLDYLNELQVNPFSVYVKFQLVLMDFLGFGLNFDSSNSLIFDEYLNIGIDKGEVVNNSSGFKLSKINFNKMIYLYQNDMSDSYKVEFDEKSSEILTVFFNVYFKYHLDRNYYINSLEINKI